MNGRPRVIRALRWPAWTAAVASTGIAVVAVAQAVDNADLASAAAAAGGAPEQVALALGAFATAFLLRAVAWRRILPALPLGHALGAIHLTLGANHVLPLRLGEPLRIVSATRRAGIPVDAATASTLTLRAADVVTVAAIAAGLGAVVAPSVLGDIVIALGPVPVVIAAAVVLAAAVLGWRWLAALARRRPEVRRPAPAVLALTAAAWVAESVLVLQAARWAGLDPAWWQALLVTAVAVAVQVAAVAPGGFGTYEAAAVAAYVALGFDAEPALVAALAAHALKTAYAVGTGMVAVAVPAPGLLGRLRLRPAPGDATATPTPRAPAAVDPARNTQPSDGPVLLFLPAHDEAASIGRCLRRVPAEVCGRRVEVLVVDDGSTDDTAAIARRAGAEVRSLGRNRGLGAAVRVGLAEGVDRRAAAIAFCDADGEYPPEELDALVAPILAGEADYVTGSRFLGRIDHMRPHRRVGNRLLSAVLSLVARRRITDGQTGYRAFSPTAAADAEIIHDFNYAQVLTLDLLAKGHRFREVAISYRFRTEGESFVRLGPYLRHVLPAVYRELNTG